MKLKKNYRSQRKSLIHIWICSNAISKMEKYLNVLSEKERETVKNLSKIEKKTKFVVSRILIRTALSAAMRGKTQAAEWNIHTKSNGKPFALCPRNKKNIYFNLSHAKGLSIVAVSKDQEVGIDIEPLNQDLQPVDLWAVLTERERFDLALTPHEERSRNLLRIWTLKEAYLKLIGTGLSIDPATIQVSLDPLEIVTDSDPQITSSLLLKNWIIELNQELFSLSLATWKPDSVKPVITCNLFDEALGKHHGPHHFIKRTSTQEKEAWKWNDYTIYLKDAAATTKIDLQ